MSEQISLVKFKGRLGDISFFKRKGVARARHGGGVSKERIMTDPKFRRTRENISEFGGLAVSVKSFRSTLKSVSNFTDGLLGGRLTKVFRSIMKRSEAIRGQRPVLLSENRSMLQGLELSTDIDLFSVFSAPFTVTVLARNSVATAINNLRREMIEAPPTATHYRIVQFLGAVADTVYDENEKKFVTANVNNGLNAVTYSDYTSVNSADPVILNIETQIAFVAGSNDSSLSVIHGLGIVFYEKIGNEYYSLEQNSAMKIVGVI